MLAIKWKLNMYHGFRHNDFYNFNFGFMFKDLLFPDSRKRNYLLWENAPKEIARQRYGIMFTNDTPLSGLREVYFGQIYSRFPEFIPSAEDIVLDAGAQFGDYALLCSKAYGVTMVHAFEPLQANYNILDANFKLNHVGNANAYRMALGEKDSEIEIFHENDMANRYGYGKPEKVSIRTIDSLNLGKISFMNALRLKLLWNPNGGFDITISYFLLETIIDEEATSILFL